MDPLRVRVVSTGLYVPGPVETAEELAPRLGVTARWITETVGVARRHVADLPVEEMGARAARQALGSGGPPDLILYASATPRQAIPDTAVYVEQALGLDGIPAYTLHATCLSFLVGLETAATQIASRAYARVLLVSSEIGTVGRNWAEPESAALLGDGAAAAVLEPTPEGESSALLAWEMTTLPKGARLTEVRGGGTLRHPNDPATRREDNLFAMDGLGIYKMAVRRVDALILRVLERAGLADRSDVDVVVPHQASAGAMKALVRYGFDRERIVDVIAEYGNCVAASLPMALAHADRAGRLRRGDRVLLVGTGAGLSIAAAVLRW